MSTPPSTNQAINVQGELKVITTSNLGETRGRVVFEDTNRNYFGSFRVFGQYPFARLILDSAGLTSGVAFRTNERQGTIQDGGTGEKYTMEVGGSSVNMTRLSIYPPTRNLPYITQTGQSSLDVGRGGTQDLSSRLFSDLAGFSQDVFKANESILLSLGTNSNYRTVIGFNSPEGLNSSTSNYGFIGLSSSRFSSPSTHIKLTQNNAVEIPTSFTTPTASITALSTTTLNTTGIVTDTITATNYIGLPAANVLPITLDPTNSRIGINNTTPTKAVDVVGDVLASGEVAAESLRGGAFGVGYEPGVKEGWGLYRDSSTLTLYISPLTTAGVPTPSNDVSIEYNTGKVILNSIEATTGLTVGSNLINTDITNTRVGINKASPAYTLDVGGDVNIPTGSNFMINGVPISSGGSSVITVTSPNVFTATTTPPVKPTNTVADYITVQEIPDSKLCTCTFHIAWTDVTGINAGSGVYFVSLPTGYEFDLTKHPADNVITSTDGSASTGTIIPGSNFTAQMNSGTVTYYIGLGVVYDATRFAVLMQQNGKFWSNTQMGFGTAGGASNPQFSISGSFQFFKP